MRQDQFREPGELARRLSELLRAAGEPTLNAVAREAEGSSRTAPKPKITAQKISAWTTGTNVPKSFPVLESVIRVLIQRTRRMGIGNANPELLNERQWLRWWREAQNFSPPRSADKAPALGQIINERLDPFDFEVHRAISDESTERTPELPRYIEREHDRHLRMIVERAQTESTLAILVGGSSTGKTRSCWEAVQCLAGWSLWHPINPSRPEALLNALDNHQIVPKTVLWLNEMQHYLKDTESGEAVAAGLRELLRDPAHAPVLVLGTLWPEYWNVLTRRPSIAEVDSNAQCRELLSGRKIKVPDSFEEIDVAELPDVVKSDERIMQALSRPDRRVTQFLAGAFELLSKYETASATARALIDVAIDASRFGLGNTVPETVLRDVAPGYLTDYEWEVLADDDDWLANALTYVRRPCLGISGPLARVRSRSSNPASEEPLYHLADFLEDYGRRFRQFHMPPETFWNAITDYADSPETLIDLAYELQYRGRYRNAARVYLMAADAGEINGLLYLADNRRRAGDYPAAEEVLKIAADRGSLVAYINLAELRAELGDTEGAKLIFKDALVHRNIESEDRSVAWHCLVDLCEEAGDIRTARRWLKEAAAEGDDSADDELARLNRKVKDPKVVIDLKKAAAEVRRSRRDFLRANDILIKHSLANAENFAWALQYFAEIMKDEEATGRSTSALIMIGRLHDVHGNHDDAKAIFLKAINCLDDPYEYGVIPALVELFKVLKRSGDTDAASRLWKYGLELDGTIADAWNVFDQLPHASH